MAAAYRVIDRIHAPLISPLEDTNPTTAHMKVHWPSSLKRLNDVTLQSAALSGIDYSNAKPHGSRSDADDLLVLNIYKTTDLSTSWGLGPSPMSPVYLCYPALHPADRSLPKLAKSSNAPSCSYDIFSPNKQRQHISNGNFGRPNLIQFFLDRKDFITRVSSTMICVRFLEEFVEWRLISEPHPTKSAQFKAIRGCGNFADDTALKSPKSKHFLTSLSLRKASSTNSIRNLFQRSTPKAPSKFSRESIKQVFAEGSISQYKDVPAARILLHPTIRPVDQRRSRPLVNFFTSFVSEFGTAAPPMYTTLEEVGGEIGIELFFSPATGQKKIYWWVCEDSSWRVVFDYTEKEAIKKVKPLRESTADGTMVPEGASHKYTGIQPSRIGLSEAGMKKKNHKREPSSPAPSPRKGKAIFRRSGPEMVKEPLKSPRYSPLVASGSVKLYAADQIEPVASIDLSTGQMWIVKSVMLTTIDIVVAVMFAVVNLERAINDEHE